MCLLTLGGQQRKGTINNSTVSVLQTDLFTVTVTSEAAPSRGSVKNQPIPEKGRKPQVLRHGLSTAKITPGEVGAGEASKIRHDEETAEPDLEVDLITRKLEDGSKPGLNTNRARSA